MSKILRDEKPFDVDLAKLKKTFGEGSEFSEKNGFAVDFNRPLEFRLPPSQFRPDPLNEGKLLAPKNFTIPTSYTKSEDGQNRSYVYYIRKAMHTFNKGAQQREVLEPNALIVKDGRLTIDLVNGQQKDYAAAFFLLNHPKLGTSFIYYNGNIHAKQALATERQLTRISGMLTDSEHGKYIADAAVREMARKGQIAGSDSLTVEELRAALLRLGKKDPARFFALQEDNKIMQTMSLVQECLDWGIIAYDQTEFTYYMCETKAGSDGKIKLYSSLSKIYKLKDIEVNRPGIAFSNWLVDVDTDRFEIVLRAELSKAKELWKSDKEKRGTNPTFSFEKIS